MEAITVKELKKSFTITKKEKGIKGALSALVNPKKVTVDAVKGISFSIPQGEIVGYLGPNGAGKSTTVKILSGILHPSEGAVYIDGKSPHKHRKEVVKNIGVVFGQRTQLYWDLRLGESFELLKRIYNIPDEEYNENMNMLTDILGLEEILNTPVRQLSLGQRIKGDLCAAFIHSPTILFLDEPTIGLDINAKEAIRKYILELNRRKGTTVILTTHDLQDVEQLCDRLIIIDDGQIVADDSLKNLIHNFSPYRQLIVDIDSDIEPVNHKHAEIISVENKRICYRFNMKEITASKLIQDLSKTLSIRDLSVKEPNIEEMVKAFYNE